MMSNEPVRQTRALRPLARAASADIIYLLIQLRRANRTILRLREVACAAHEGDTQRLRSALETLHPPDMDPRRRRRGAVPRR